MLINLTKASTRMPKNVINLISKVIVVLVFLILSCVVIWAAGNGKLPFYDDIYDIPSHYDISGSELSFPDESSEPEVSIPDTKPDFSTYFANIASSAPSSDYILSDRVYDKNTTSFVFSKEALSSQGIQSMIPRMGYIFLTKDDGTISLLNSSGNVIFEQIPEGYVFAGVRDSQNRPLFLFEKKYYYLSGTEFVLSEYEEGRHGRGISFDYPSYYGVSDGTVERYKYAGNWGLRYTEKKGVVIYPGYKSVYYYSEDVAIAVTHNGKIALYNRMPWKYNEKYFAPLSTGIESLGYFYFDHGLTRVRKIEAEKSIEMLIHPDLAVFQIPMDFEMTCYYNGVLTLKKGDRYGYMKHTGEWLANPTMSAASPFIEGVASFRNEYGKYGMLDLSGRILLPAVFDYISDCSGGVIIAYEKDHGYYIINKLMLPEFEIDESEGLN